MTEKIVKMRPATSDQHHNAVLVTIIIPAYNTEEYIHRAIESSLRQTHKNVEVLVIDDGSTDRTLEVSREYAKRDSRVRVYHQENAGVSSARNHGIREAQGEYLVFLDSDDWLSDDAVETLLEAQFEHPNNLISANFYRVEYGEASGTIATDETIPSQFVSIEDTVDNMSSYKINGIPSPWGKIFSASLVREHGLNFIEGMTHAEDRLFMFEYLKELDGLFYVSHPVLYIYARPGSETRSPYNPESMRSTIRAHDEMMKLPGNTPEIIRKLEIAQSFDLHFFLSRAFTSRAGSDEINFIRKHIRHRFECMRRIKSRRGRFRFLCQLYIPVPLFYTLKALKAKIFPPKPKA